MSRLFNKEPERKGMADKKSLSKTPSSRDKDVFLPGVYELRESYNSAAPLVFDSPHSGRTIPEDFNCAIAETDLLRAQDSYVDQLFAGVTTAGASLLAAQFPRSYIDPNRASDDIDSRMLDQPWPGVLRPTDKTRLGHGLIWRNFPPDQMMYTRRLSLAEVSHRLEHYWRPYHDALSKMLDTRYEQFGCVFHVNCHSMPAGSSPLISRRTGSNRADIVLGDKDGLSCDPGFTDFVRQRLTQKGYSVCVNDPYKGAYIVEAYSDPKRGRHSLQIEINRSIYMDERTLTKSRTFASLQRDLTGLAFDIRDFSADRSSFLAAE